MASLSSLLSLSPYSGGKNQSSIPRNKSLGVNYVSCKASNGENGQNPQAGGDSSLSKFDRRDMLFGLGGLYGATAFGGNKFALAEDSSLSPDIMNCKESQTPVGLMDCCPPKIKEIYDFIPPVIETPRVRPAVHLMTPTQLADLERGIKMMIELNKYENDPRSFNHQAKVHCAYCDYAYSQLNSSPEVDLQVHFNALFFPFHRAYLYFFERILSDLIGKPDFAIPFWNWDSPCGMYMPQVYTKSGSPLYDKKRDARHQPPTLLYLNYDGKNEHPGFDIVDCNLRWMNKRMSVKTPTEFLGKLIKLGETPSIGDSGSIEMSPHNNVHNWVGNPNEPDNGDDMGNFHSAGYDPLFYAHHGNVDRLWNIWQTMDNEGDYIDQDWFDSSFVLYDEKQNAIRIKVSDCLNSANLGYVYQDVENPWMNTPQIPRAYPWARTKESEPPTINFPQTLDSDITTMVERPSGGERTNEKEVLVLEDVEFDPTLPLHFNVLLNVGDEGDDVCPGNIEFVGTFRNIPHGVEHHEKIRSLRFVISDAIQELGLVGEKELAVKIVPTVNGDRIKLGGISIQLE